jgi:acyl dehydratase
MGKKLRWEDLSKGMELPPRTFQLSAPWVEEYKAVVEDGAIEKLGTGVVPPMAVAALAIRSLLESVGLPPGAVHVGQEVAFLREVSAGQRVKATAHVASRGQRGGWALLIIDQHIEDEEGCPVMNGRATVTAILSDAA